MKRIANIFTVFPVNTRSKLVQHLIRHTLIHEICVTFISMNVQQNVTLREEIFAKLYSTKFAHSRN